MEQFKTIVPYESFDQITQQLIDEAIKCREFAYAPYSQFKVGSSVQCSSGKIYTGCNVENSSFGLSICAERTALVKTVSSGDSSGVVKIIVAAEQDDKFVAPCGACRQFIHEFSRTNNIEILLASVDKSKVAVTNIRELLPFGFFL